MIIYENTAKEV